MTNSNLFFIYLHTCPNGKVYVGLTKRLPEKRWDNGNGYKKNKHFYSAIKKYGWDNIKHEILCNTNDIDDACALEKKYIKEYKADQREYGYNNTSGGIRYKRNEESRKSVSGKNNSQWGRKWTPEELAIRQSHRKYAIGGDNPTAKPILQFTKDGKLVKRWGSIADAGRAYNRTSIKDCLKGKYKVGCGYIWKYESEE